MTQEKRDSASPAGLLSVGTGSQGVGEQGGEDREGVGQGYFLPLSVEYGLQDAPVVKAQTVTSVLLLVMKYGCGGG